MANLWAFEAIEGINAFFAGLFGFLVILLFVSLITGVIALFLGIVLGDIFMNIIKYLNLFYINLGLIIFLVVLSFLFDSLLGLWVLITAFLVGLLAHKLEVHKVHMMACIILPVLMYLLSKV